MEKVYAFLRALDRNNNREWFQEHRKEYQGALELMREFASVLLQGISRFDPSVSDLDPKETLFRIYKDIRFSKDKTPYKTHFGCWMARGGRKSTDAGYYFHMQPDQTFMAAGVHSPPKEQLHLIRQEILYRPEEYLKVTGETSSKGEFERGGEEDKLKTGPLGFPKDFKYLDELNYKHYIFMKGYSNDAVLKSSFPVKLVNDYRELFPLVEYLNHAMSFTGNE
ncbi:MAG: DUF2461 domain-containing protein [Bacteroidales bacterium]